MKKFNFPQGELINLLKSLKKEFVWVGIFSMVANLLMLSPTLYMLQVYDRVMISQSELTLIFLTLIVTFFMVIMAASEILRTRLLVRIGIRIDNLLTHKVFGSSFLANLDRKQLNSTETLNDLTVMRQFITGPGVIALFDLPWTPINIIVVSMLHPLLGLATTVFCGIQLWLNKISREMTETHFVESMHTQLHERRFLASKLKNAEVVESMGMLESLRKRWQVLHLNAININAKASHKTHIQQSITKYFRYFMQSASLGLGALLVIKGELNIGAMVATNLLISRALQPLDMIGMAYRSFMETKNAYYRVEKLLEEFPLKEKQDFFQPPAGLVEIKNLTAYVPGPRAEKVILNNLNAQFKTGELTVILGPSGSGKSTLARCLVGVWQNYQGEVQIDGVEMREWSKNDLGPYLGYLPQDIELFDGSVAENIARFYEVNPNHVIEAAKATGIHDMILRFPQGYDTKIGVAGQNLSGGQRQRLGLARAIYGHPKIIVLDEPNANLDDAGERALLETLTLLKNQGLTLFLVSHRMDVLSVADNILLMDAGNIVSYGPKDIVLAQMNTQRLSA